MIQSTPFKDGSDKSLSPGRNDAARRFQIIAIFAAFSMFSATLEYLFPRPVPFFRLGLANLPILLAFPVLDFSGLLILTLLKVIGQALVNGTLASYVFLLSFAGSFASFFVMYGLYRLSPRGFSYPGLSLAGALASNTVQSVFSVLFIFGDQAWVILPLFYGLGFAAGLVIGILAEIISRQSLWLSERYRESGERGLQRLAMNRHHESSREAPEPARDELPDSATESLRVVAGASEESSKSRRPRRPGFLSRQLSTPAAFIAGILSLFLFMPVEVPAARLVQVLLLMLLTLLSGKRLLWTYFIFLLASVTFFHLLVPQGRVLASLGSFSITEGALLAGLHRGLTILGLVFISLFSIRKDLKIPGTLGRLITLTLKYFEHIYEYRRGAKIGGLVDRLDRVLYELEDFSQEGNRGTPPAQESSASASVAFTGGDFFWILLIGILMALPLVFQDILSIRFF